MFFRNTFAQILATLRFIVSQNQTIITQGARIMSMQSDLDAATAQVAADAKAALAALADQKTQLATMGTQIAALQAQVAAGNIDPAAFAADLAVLAQAHTDLTASLPVAPAPTPAP